MRSVRGVEYNSRVGFQHADGNSFAVIAFKETVCDAGTENAVDPTFQNGRGLPPPVRMHDNNTVCFRNFVAMQLQLGWERRPGRNLLGRKDGIELLCIQIMERYRMAGVAKFLNGHCGNSVIEATFIRMSKDNRNSHVSPIGKPNAQAKLRALTKFAM